MSESSATTRLTGKQNRFLRGLGHGLKPFIMIGKQHISDDVVKATNEALATHELIKVRVQEGCLIDRKTIAAEVAAATGSAVARILGSTFLLYRQSDEPTITLP